VSAIGARVLVTRPEPGLTETVEAVRAAGFEPIACPLLRVSFRTPSFPAHVPDAVVITSGQAVAALTAAMRHGAIDAGMPLFAVGDRTANRARDAGFSRVESASGNAEDLHVRIESALERGSRLVLMSGAGEGLGLAQSLRRAGYHVIRRVGYAARPVPRLPGDAMAAWAAAPAAALFFSAATARAFVGAASDADEASLRRAQAIAISGSVALELAARPWAGIRVAARPDATAMLDALSRP